MYSILVNAYACSPDMGSEPGMAWNWCINLANYCELHIITEGEFRDKIEAALPSLPQGGNMHFYYNPISEKIRKMCWNQGDWRFYRYYKKWQRKTLEIAMTIISEHHIDVIHQLNMIGFREPGYLWEIENIPFVWGPIGGLKQFPLNYSRGAGLKMRVFNTIKNYANIFQIKYGRRINKAFCRADILVSAIPDSYYAIKKFKGLESMVIPETGCFVSDNIISDIKDTKAGLQLIWVAKFDFRKRLDLALKTIARIKHIPNLSLHICGSGSDKQICYYRNLAKSLGIEKNIIWHGNIAHEAVIELMRHMDAFLFTSVSEDTSTVVLEAISCQLPVICFNTCGMGFVVNDNVGMKINLTNPEQSVEDFAQKIEYLYHHKDILHQLSENCKQRQKELSWENKARQMYDLYKKALEKESI